MSADPRRELLPLLHLHQLKPCVNKCTSTIPSGAGVLSDSLVLPPDLGSYCIGSLTRTIPEGSTARKKNGMVHMDKGKEDETSALPSTRAGPNGPGAARMESIRNKNMGMGGINNSVMLTGYQNQGLGMIQSSRGTNWRGSVHLMKVVPKVVGGYDNACLLPPISTKNQEECDDKTLEAHLYALSVQKSDAPNSTLLHVSKQTVPSINHTAPPATAEKLHATSQHVEPASPIHPKYEPDSCLLPYDTPIRPPRVPLS